MRPNIRILLVCGVWYAMPRNKNRATRAYLVQAINFCRLRNAKEGRS